MVAPTTTAPQHVSPFIPETLSDDIATAATQYADCLKAVVVPIDPTTKSPGSILGKGWPAKASRDPSQIKRWWAQNPDAGIGIVTGPSNLIVFDLDVDSVPAELNWLRISLIQTSRLGGSERGHYIFGSSETFMSGDLRLLDGTKVGDIRSGNTIFVAYPTPHSKGGEYRWTSTGEVPELPAIALTYLSAGAGVGPTADISEIEAFSKEHTAQIAPSYLEPVLRDYQRELSESLDNTHTPTFAVLCRIARESRAGAYAFRPAVKLVRAIATQHYESRDRPFDRADFTRCIGDAVARALAENLDDLKARVFRDYGTDTRNTMSASTTDDDDPFSDDDDPFADDGIVDELPLEPSNYEVREAARKMMVRRAADRLVREVEAEQLLEQSRVQSFNGVAFLEDIQPGEPVWGSGKTVAWAKSQGFMVFGTDGTGKSTLLQQIMLARLGLRDPDVLGFPVSEEDRSILYLALDRPVQIRESIARMVDLSNPNAYDTLKSRLVVVKGPVPFQCDSNPRAFFEWCMSLAGEDCGMVIVDSVKDMVSSCVDDAAGAGFNDTMQQFIAKGIDFGCAHHNRKANAQNAKPRALADVYGSRWLTAGMGAVLNIWRNDDHSRELTQLKTPYGNAFRPVEYTDDYASGQSTVTDDWHSVLVGALMAARGTGLTDAECVFKVFKQTPKDAGYEANRQKITRRIDRWMKAGHTGYQRVDAVRDGKTCKVWRLVSPDDDVPEEPSDTTLEDRKRAAQKVIEQIAAIDQKIVELDSETK